VTSDHQPIVSLIRNPDHQLHPTISITFEQIADPQKTIEKGE
jgi:hypothetical protein